MGGVVDGRPMGTLGDAAFASFQWTKPVTAGLGGVVRVNDPELLAALADFHGRELAEPALSKTLMLSVLAWGYRHFFSPRLYWTARGAYHAAGRLGLAAPSASDEELERPEVMPDGYLERFGRRRMGQLGDALLAQAREARVELGDWFNAPLHPDIHESDGLGYRQGMCPNAELLARHSVNLPTHPSVDEREAARILDFLAGHADRILDVSALLRAA